MNYKYEVIGDGERIINGIRCKKGDIIELDKPTYRSKNFRLIKKKKIKPVEKPKEVIKPKEKPVGGKK